uniref:Centrosomal AT-AC splicing factor n=1 Tax=Canis lupus familiaris TaxID=9615 RepID=A0A8I3MN21_CANLF
MAPAQRCPLCRQTFFCGRGHVYSRKHQRQLKAALERLLPQVRTGGGRGLRTAWGGGCGRCREGARGETWGLHWGPSGPLSAAGGGRPQGHPRRSGGALRAGARAALLVPVLRLRGAETPEPRKPDRAARGAAGASGQMAAQIREVEHSRQELVQSVLEPQAVPDPEEGSSALGSWKGTNSLVASTSQQPSYLDLPPTPELDWMETGQPLTFIGHQDTPGIGNIHSGATPPWMVQDEEYSSVNQQIGPSYEEFLKEKEKQKLKKLPPDRVGANFDHSSSTSVGWLPSFGRVWNNGRRWQSRHQFKTEAAARNKQSCKEKKPIIS